MPEMPERINTPWEIPETRIIISWCSNRLVSSPSLEWLSSACSVLGLGFSYQESWLVNTPLIGSPPGPRLCPCSLPSSSHTLRSPPQGIQMRQCPLQRGIYMCQAPGAKVHFPIKPFFNPFQLLLYFPPHFPLLISKPPHFSLSLFSFLLSGDSSFRRLKTLILLKPRAYSCCFCLHNWDSGFWGGLSRGL